MRTSDAPTLDRPWKRPGAMRYALARVRGMLRPPVEVQWLWPRNPLTGQFPGAYRSLSRGTATLHCGPDREARLLMPVVG
jgi:uncharacterized protein